MTPQRRLAINELADTVRSALALELPINMSRAVEGLGGELLYNLSPSDPEALVEKHGEAFRIRLRRGAKASRDRFSVAHELGHLFLHMGYLVDPKRWDGVGTYRDSVMYRFGYSEEEYEAHEFAAAFLMPKDQFVDVALKHLKNGNFDLDAIAQAFDVSREAAKNRGRWLGLFAWDK
jgi:predicted transcriptional regulator